MRTTRTLLLLVLAAAFAWTATPPQLRQLGMVTIPGAPGFSSLAWANGMLVMSHPGASTVDIFDPVRRRVAAQITGIASPRGVAVDQQNRKVYVADADNRSIAVIATGDWSVSGNIPVPGTPDALCLDETGSRLYWSDSDKGTLSLLDLSTRQNLATVSLAGTPRYLAADVDHHLVFVSVQDTNQVVGVDAQLKIVNRFSVNGSQPTGLVYDPRFQSLYVAVRKAVLALNARTGDEVSRVPASPGVDMLWLDPESRTVYAAGNGSLQVLSANGSLVNNGELKPDIKGHTVAYDSERKMVLLPGGREGKSAMLILRPVPNSQTLPEAKTPTR